MVRRSLPNAVATGRPTYPRPTTATVAVAVSGALRAAGAGAAWGGNSRISDMREPPFLSREHVFDVPVDGLRKARAQVEQRPVAEEPLRLGSVGAREQHVAAP